MKKSKKNYQAWSVDLKKFPVNSINRRDKIFFISKYAILAPSSHNTQPWLFRITDSSILIYINENHKLKEADPTNRELYVSLGCCIANLQTALDAFSVGYTLNLLPLGHSNDLVAEFLILDHNFDLEKAIRSPQLEAIVNRHSDRSEHLPMSSVSAEKQLIDSLISKNFKNFKFRLFLDKEKEALADISSNAAHVGMSSVDFRKELSLWVKNNYTKSGVGMPGFLMGVPNFISIFLPFLIKFFKPNEKGVNKDRDFLNQKTNFIGILFTPEDKPLSWLLAGIEVENFILDLFTNQVKVSFYSASIEVTDFYKKIQEKFSETARPLVFLRIGKTQGKVLFSPRLTLEECLKA